MILRNDLLLPEEDVRVSFKDRGYYFGDGIYEVFRIYQGHLFEKEAHLTRLERSAQEARIPLPYSRNELIDRLERLVLSNGVMQGTLYMQITRGEAPRAHPFPQDAAPILTGWCAETQRPFSSMRDGISAITLEDIRWHRCDIKTLNLLPNVLAKQEAIDRGTAEAILHRGDSVTECSSSNIMVVKGGVIHTHPANHFILHGVTRAVVLHLAKQSGIPVHERACTLTELTHADEVFITGTTVEVTPIVRINERQVGDGTPGPITRKLQHAFEAYANLA